jgi:hypothetical protein
MAARTAARRRRRSSRTRCPAGAFRYRHPRAARFLHRTPLTQHRHATRRPGGKYGPSNIDVPDLDVDGHGPAAEEEKMSACMRFYVKGVHLVSARGNLSSSIPGDDSSSLK